MKRISNEDRNSISTCPKMSPFVVESTLNQDLKNVLSLFDISSWENKNKFRIITHKRNVQLS